MTYARISFRRQVADSDRRNIIHSKQLGRLDPAVTSDDPVGGVDQNRTHKAEFFDALRNLSDLPLRVSARIMLAGPELDGILIRNFEVFGREAALWFERSGHQRPPSES